MTSPWRRFSLQVNNIGFTRKKSEPNVIVSPTTNNSVQTPTSGGQHQHTPRQLLPSQYLSSSPRGGGGPGGGGRLSVDSRAVVNRDSSPSGAGGGRYLNSTESHQGIGIGGGASSTPGSPKQSRRDQQQQWLGTRPRDSSPASSGGGGFGTSTRPSNMMVSSAGGGTGGSWYDDVPGGGSGGEGMDEMDGAGSAGAHDSRSSGGGSADWTASFADGSTSLDVEKMRVMNKIEHVKEKLVAANKTKEADVDEFLRLTSNVPVSGDNPQMIRIRQVFEKKNKKSAQTILLLQKKLDSYQHKLRDLDSAASGGVKKPRTDYNVLTNVGQGLKDVGANIKESLTGYTGTVISVPKDLAHRLLKKSDSADNIHNSSPNQRAQTPPPVPTTSGSGRGAYETPQNNYHHQDTMDNSGQSKQATTGGSSSRSVQGGPTAVFYTDVEHNRDRAASDATSPPDAMAPPASRTYRSASPPSAVHPSASARTMQQQQYQLQDTPRRVPSSSQQTNNNAHHPQHHYDQHHSSSQFDQLVHEMHAMKRSNDQMAEAMNELKTKIQHEYAYFHQSVHELTFRVQRIEDQLNDQAELHSAEVNGLRGDLQTVEGRVSYQMSQVDGDLKDVIGRVTTRVEAMENRVKDQFGVDHNAVGTLAIRAGYLLAQTFLTIVFLLTQGLLPFMKTRARSVTTVLVIVFAVILYRNLHLFEELTSRLSNRT